MATLTIVYWRAIPAQVIARSGRKTAKRELPPAFADAIDRAAMRAGLTGTDAYLEAWHHGPPTSCGDDLEHEANETARLLFEAYPVERLKVLIASGGEDGQ